MPTKKPKSKTIFLSHSSADKELVDALSDLLTTGCDVSGDDIIITTLPGQGIPGGTPNYVEWLRQKGAVDSALVILLLSPNYFESEFCLCEMGASWGLEKPCFPLVVPPLKNSEIKAVMVVSQNMNIEATSCLDELRDKVSELLGTSQPTPKWNVKRDAFLKKLPGILKNLPKPERVDRKVLEEAEAKYEASQDEIAEKEAEIAKLKRKVADLEKCKNKAEVKAVREKYSSHEELFDKLCETAGAKLNDLEIATSDLLFCERGGQGKPAMDADWYESANKAAAKQEMDFDERYSVRTDHPRVQKAEAALDELQRFIDGLPDGEFEEDFREKHEFPLSLRNKEFWDFVHSS